ncbi:MAG: DUF4112 domain-containing protein [Hymenobacteraceae bacterium]|nr:DUF4112 domain-containing protein [Hymenobacteraceae bacterium]MDX5397325.1 DUF4112 domain-containing protein [Hymenobacteraceae bacterium]MDX5444214.1 DUF4112 domain-containing protein [Hymenobacteraceae bacterium]MDX5513404.1 DUF4112 domain-containing protein [Hymenobacteraceae bacterium]
MKHDKAEQINKLRWVEQVSKLMDSQFRIPGTNFRFGLDPILGFVPVAGDMTSFLVSATLILTMVKYGASRKVIILMVLNVAADTIIGSIPIIGNLFDFFYKANERNMRLLRGHYTEGKYRGSGTGIVIIVIVSLLLLFVLLLWGLWELVEYVYHLF